MVNFLGNLESKKRIISDLEDLGLTSPQRQKGLEKPT
jgi:hypothetical protein